MCPLVLTSPHNLHFCWDLRTEKRVYPCIDVSLTVMSEAIEMTPYRVGVAFAVVIAAGLCTTVGAFAVFCAGVANKKVLSGALGASAGTY